MTVKASDICFGVEVECTLPSNTDIEIAGHYSGPQVRWLPDGWQGRSDSSVRASSGYRVAEIVSPILSGEEGLTQVWYALGMIKELHGRVNDSCGLHVHVDARNMTEKQVKAVRRAFVKYERAFYGLNGSMAQFRWSGNGNTWCKRSDQWSSGMDQDDRYRSLNITNYYRETNKKTLECRVWAGCLDEERVVTAVYMIVALVAAVLNGNVKDDVTGRIESAEQAARSLMSETFNNVSNRIVEDCTVREVSQVLLTACRESSL